MAFDMQKLMQDPMMVTALNMMAQSGFQPGANAGSRLGAAGLNSMRQLQGIETASANRTWRENQSKIQEERNKIAQEMQQKRFELQQKQFAETQRANQAAEDITGQPLAWHAPTSAGAPGTYTMGGRPVSPRYEDPMAALMRSLNTGNAPTLPGMPSTAAPPGGQAAPAAALQYLQANPDQLPAFIQKYGYDPTR